MVGEISIVFIIFFAIKNLFFALNLLIAGIILYKFIDKRTKKLIEKKSKEIKAEIVQMLLTFKSELLKKEI